MAIEAAAMTTTSTGTRPNLPAELVFFLCFRLFIHPPLGLTGQRFDRIRESVIRLPYVESSRSAGPSSDFGSRYFTPVWLSGLGNFVMKGAEINYQSVMGLYALMSPGQFESKAV